MSQKTKDYCNLSSSTSSSPMEELASPSYDVFNAEDIDDLHTCFASSRDRNISRVRRQLFPDAQEGNGLIVNYFMW